MVVACGYVKPLANLELLKTLKSGKHKWNNLKDRIVAEKDESKQSELRKKSVTSDYFIGSIHAVAETGEILIASASGSQLPSYAFSSNNIIWVVGTQKIASNLENAFKRVREYCFPCEDKRMKNLDFSVMLECYSEKRETNMGSSNRRLAGC